MNYQSVADTAKSWNVSERTVRNYCATGKIPGAVLIGKTWNIPQDAERPERINKKQQAPRTLLTILQDEMTGHVKGGIYHKIQIDLTYNSNHIEGSRLSHDQTRYIYETNTIGMENGVVNVDDVVETANHFKCIDMVIRDAKKPINEALIKKLPSRWKTCWNSTMPLNPSIRFRMEMAVSGGFCSSRSVCGIISCRSSLQMTSSYSTIEGSMNGSPNAAICWTPA